MCENFLKLHGFCILIIVLLIFAIICIICKMKKKDPEEKSKFKSICEFIKAYCIYIITLVISFFILYLILSVNSNILQLISDDKMGEALGLIISAVITVTGVFVGFYFNKKQTYKEIVTRERIEWLHKMQEALAEFMSITSKDDFADEDEYKIYRARELYYLIISNLNVKEDKEKKNKNKNEREAVELLYKYANSKGLDVELNFDRNVDSDEDKDSNATKSIDELKEEKEKLIDEIKTLGEEKQKLKDRYENSVKKEEDPLAGLKRKEIISKYTEIFNETWNRIKNEAD